MSQTQEHKRKLSLSEREVVVIQKMVTLLQTAKAGLERDLCAANQFIDRVEAANAELETQLNASNLKVTLLETINAKLDDQNNDTKVMNNRLEGRIIQLEAQLSASKEKAKVLESYNAKLDSQFNASNDMNDRLEAQIAELQTTCTNLITDKARLTYANYNVKRLYGALIEAHAKLASTNSDLKRQTLKLVFDASRLREAVDDAERENVQLRAMNVELNDTVHVQHDIIQIGVFQRQRLLGSTDPGLLDENRPSDDEDSVVNEQDSALRRDRIDDISDFSVGIVNGESWGTNYYLEEQFKVGVEEADKQDNDSSQGYLNFVIVFNAADATERRDKGQCFVGTNGLEGNGLLLGSGEWSTKKNVLDYENLLDKIDAW